MIIMSISLAIVSIVLTAICIPMTIIAIIKVEALMKSTHKIEYRAVGFGDVPEISAEEKSKVEDSMANPDDGFINYKDF